MLAILFGLFAALCWSVHDLLASRYAKDVGPVRMAINSMLAGAIILVGIVLWNGTLFQAAFPQIVGALFLGLIYGVAVASLFKAFSMAPVSIVGPFTAGYPALVVGWGMLNGLQPSWFQGVAIIIVLLGAYVVGRMGPPDGGLANVAKGQLLPLFFFCVLASICFASSVIIGQKLAFSIGEFETTFLTRIPAALILLPFAARETSLQSSISRNAGLAIFAMGAFDVAAVSSVNYMGFLPHKEFGSMGISAYGAIATLLAMIFLKEKTTLWQWAGIAMICIGVAVLGSG